MQGWRCPIAKITSNILLEEVWEQQELSYTTSLVNSLTAVTEGQHALSTPAQLPDECVHPTCMSAVHTETELIPN